MKDEMFWMKMKWMSKNVTNDFLLSLAVSFFGLILIFGLGFVFPEINPYSAIKWIVIVSAVFFVYSLVSFVFMKFMIIKASLSMRNAVKKEVKAVKGKKASK
ncbi:MAG: hypothetical protein ACD_13C00249G0022 [uncultured bacterium]|nr:MAG: hypothetical protein ACD_13C00249G0022 [uncultured bacterium]HAU64935.1 hypothetical protein [Candidatus Woesebacteria bacterium]HCC08516.1 hypothetical protein [Candidatus Woesebacteria bacterium]